MFLKSAQVSWIATWIDSRTSSSLVKSSNLPGLLVLVHSTSTIPHISF